MSQEDTGKYILLENWSKALLDNEKAVTLDPKFSLAYRNLAISKINLGRIKSACGDLQKALDLEKNIDKDLKNFKNKLCS